MALAQFQESMPATTKYHALVRSEEEAEKLRFDLAGVKVVEGKPVLANSSRLDHISIIILAPGSNVSTINETLRRAFTGVTYAMLCDAGHSEIVPRSDGKGVEVRMPLEADTESPFQLLDVISGLVKFVQQEEATYTSGSRLKHVLMRGTMGVACIERCVTQENAYIGHDGNEESLVARCDLNTEAALEIMGGRVPLYGKLICERALVASGLPHTILRLGALTDDAGMVPLRFGGGGDDTLLLEHVASDSTLEHRGEPPKLSRTDAVRVSIELLRHHPAPSGEIIDCAWAVNWGVSSAGTEDSKLNAARQHRTLVDEAREASKRAHVH